MRKFRLWLSMLILSMSVFLSACERELKNKSQLDTPQEESFHEELIDGQQKESAATDNRSDGQSSEEETRLAVEPLSVEEIINSYETELPDEIPDYSGNAYAELNHNIPFFTKSNLPTESFEYYSELDELGRCKTVCANIGQDIMPDEERGDIGQIKPSGWHTVKYDNVDGKYLYNRCHFIGFQLAGENANEKNLITGTRYMNVEGMLPFENMVADYVKETDNHVLYRVSPIFEGNNLLASGVVMEGWSVEDDGAGICFNVFVYNAQPDIIIDYATGESSLNEGIQEAEEASGADMQEKGKTSAAGIQNLSDEPDSGQESASEPEPQGTTYILNTNTKKFHYPSCSSVNQMKESNKEIFTGNRDDVISRGYEPCKRCNP